MEKTRMWTFVALVGLFAAGDWFVAFTDAGDQEKKVLAWKGEKASAWLIERDVTVKDKVEKHTFLEITGDFKGKMGVSAIGSPNDEPMMEASRMGPRPVARWNKTIEVDTDKERLFDLGVKEDGDFFRIVPHGLPGVNLRALNVPRVNKLKIALKND